MRINPSVTGYFTGDGARNLHALEEETGRRFFFEGSEGLPLEHFAVTQEGTREEIETEAVPFSEGDEVHVHIVEPHMYNDDDAVAKVDGYISRSSTAIPYVGEKKLVLIEEAGRTGAARRARRRRGRGGRRGGRARAKATKERARRRARTPAKTAAKPAPKEKAAELPTDDLKPEERRPDGARTEPTATGDDGRTRR